MNHALEMPTCIAVETRKARKQHKCCECRGKIQCGETYEHVRGIWCREPSTYKTCQDCIALRRDLSALEENGYTGLNEAVCESGDTDIRGRWVAIMRKREAKVHWTWLRGPTQHAFPPVLILL